MHRYSHYLPQLHYLLAFDRAIGSDCGQTRCIPYFLYRLSLGLCFFPSVVWGVLSRLSTSSCKFARVDAYVLLNESPFRHTRGGGYPGCFLDSRQEHAGMTDRPLA
jgi:hypothetical protein